MTVALANQCDREPIQYPGKIQDHGAIMVINLLTRKIEQASGNIDKYVGFSSAELMGKTAAEVFPSLGQQPSFTHGDYQIVKTIENQSFYLISHYTSDHLLLELEPVRGFTYNPEELLGGLISANLSAADLQNTLQQAAKKVKELSGFHRVMIYKFHEDGHGEVVAEVVDKKFGSYLGLHYPASDIPKQARELYKKNLVRLIADVYSTPISLEKFPTRQPVALDLSDSVLRAVSPTHIQYLKNMGVAASFSISILSKGELWGLIACHNYEAKALDYRQRLHAKMIGQLVSSSVHFQAEEEKHLLHMTWRENTATLVRQMRQADQFMDGVFGSGLDLLSINSAQGAALLYDDQIKTVGKTPNTDAIRAIAGYLHNAGTKQVYHTNELSAVFPPAAEWQQVASGLLCAPLSNDRKEFILWFKQQKDEEIKWAGNPEKAIIANPGGDVRIEPRTSFAIFSQSIKGRSEKWSSSEISNAQKLRDELLLLIQEKMEHLRSLNDELKKAYEELDSFSYTISHDLKTPLSTIHNFAELLLEEDPAIDNRLLTQKIKRNAERMQQMIKAVFRYTKLSREQINPQPIDMKHLLTQIREDLLDAYKDIKPDLQIGETPVVYGDSTMIGQVFANLVGNAVKYSSKKEKPEISIVGTDHKDFVTYTISDNGIGMDPRHTAKLFHLFYRLPGASSFEGTGLGLAIVKRIVDKHKGELWFETAPQQGTRFFIKLRKNA